MQANQGYYTNAQGTQGAQWNNNTNKGFYNNNYATSAPPLSQQQQYYGPPPTSTLPPPISTPNPPTVSIQKGAPSASPFPPLSSLPPPLPPNLQPPALSTLPPPGDIPPPLPPKPKIYQQQALYQHPSLATVEGTSTGAPYLVPQVPMYENPPGMMAPVQQQPPQVPLPPTVQQSSVAQSSIAQGLNFAPGLDQAKRMKFKCNASKQHPYTGGHAMYDMRGYMLYDVQVLPGGKGRDHVVMDHQRREVLRTHFRTTTLRVEFQINTPQGPKVAVYNRHKMRKMKEIELDGVTYFQRAEKVGNHKIFHPKIYKWGPEGAPEVAMRAGDDLFIYPTCPPALEIALVFTIAHLCHIKDVQPML